MRPFIICCLLLAALLPASVSAGELTIDYGLKKDGNVSVAVYNSDGVLVREIARAERQAAGKHTLRWDGLDQLGRPVPPGDYTWKLLHTQGLTSEYLLSIGTQTLERHWPGQHGGIEAVVIVGNDMFLASSAEGSPGMVKVSLDGTYQWAANSVEPWTGPTDLAFADGRIFAPIGNGTFYVFDPADGKTIKRLKLLEPVIRLDFDDAAGATAPGWKSAKPAVYAKEAGCGWDSIDGIQAIDRGGENPLDRDGHAVTRLASASDSITDDPQHAARFLIDLPNGSYVVRVMLGDGRKSADADCRVDVDAQGRNAGHFDNSKDGTGTLEFDAEVKDGQLALRFWLAAKNRAGKDSFSFFIRGIEVGVRCRRVASSGKELVVCFPTCVQWWNPADCAVIDSAPLAAAKDATITPDGTVLAISGDSIVSLTRAAKTPLPKITGLTNPHLIEFDPATSSILVAERGDSQQIKRFDKDFKLTAAYGRKGGREYGKYVPENFLDVDGIASDGKGGFVIVEGFCAPRRTSHFNAKGSLVSEWIGGQMFFEYAAVDPDDPSIVWLDSQWGSIIQAKVNYEARTWKVLATYFFGGIGGGTIPMKGNAPGGWMVRRHKGRTYLVRGQGLPRVMLVDEPGKRLIPLAACDTNITHYWDYTPKVVQDLLGNRQAKWRTFTWCDRSNDGMPQADEIALGLFSNWEGWGQYVDGDLNYSCVTRNSQVKRYELRQMNVLQWHGIAPEYPTLDAAPLMTLECAGGRFDQSSPGIVQMERGDDGSC